MSEQGTPQMETEARPPHPRLRSMRTAVLVGAAVSLAVIVPMAVRAALDGRAALAQARATEEVDLRIERLGHAARWRLPIASHDEEALDALMQLGASEDPDVALAANREARRALLGTRAWGLSDPARFETLCERIAAAMAEQEEAAGTDVGELGDPYAYHLQLLQDVPGPDPLRAGGAAWAFVAWLAAFVGFIGRGIDDAGRLMPAAATRWGLSVLTLLAAWAVLLATA